METPRSSERSPKAEAKSSSTEKKPYHLTPSEIESLRRDKQQACRESKGRYLHLRSKAK